MPLVLDNSVVSGWLLDNQSTPYTDAIARRLQDDRAVAPPLLRLEYTNVLWTACKRNRINAQQAQEAIGQLAACRSTSTRSRRMQGNCWRWHCNTI